MSTFLSSIYVCSAMNFAHISFMSLVMSLIPYRPIIWLAIVILHYIKVYYPLYILENSPQYSSYTECMDFIQILCFTPKAHRNLFFFQELLSHSVVGFTMHVIW